MSAELTRIASDCQCIVTKVSAGELVIEDWEV